MDIFFLKIRANLHLKNAAPEGEKYKNKDKESYTF
jgi:hypothetical protein